MKTDYRSMFDRNYVAHFDLPDGQDLDVTIKQVTGGELTAIGGRKQKKPILHFQEEVKPLALNKTNGKTIATLYGNHVEDWKGRRITLFQSVTRDPSGGDDVPCIRIRPKAPEGAAKPVKLAGAKGEL